MGNTEKPSGGTITSIDGTRTITVEEFDQLFDDASDEIDEFIDWTQARRVGGALEVRVGRTDQSTKVYASHRKLPRDAAE